MGMVIIRFANPMMMSDACQLRPDLIMYEAKI